MSDIKVPKAAILERFREAVNKNNGISLQDIGAGSRVVVQTQHHAYTILVLDPFTKEVVVVGGEFFPEAEHCTLSGSTAGGSFLKMGWIGLGMRLEFRRRGQSEKPIIITSLVQSISPPEEFSPKSSLVQR